MGNYGIFCFICRIVESLNCGRNLTDSVISAYKVIYEGRGDIDALRYYSDVFNKTREITNRNVCINTFIEGDNRVQHTMSLHGNTGQIGKSNGI